MTTKFYITTAIDYSNGEPHLGHAYEKIGADCIARYRRLRGYEVHFVIGMDEHGQKVAQAADEIGTNPQEWVDEIAQKFQAAWTELSISNTDFIRTTEERHTRAAQELLGRIQKAGHIHQGIYSGYYCVGCESFKQEKDLVGGQCPLHPTREISWLEEPNYFFNLGAFRHRLLEFYEANYSDARDFVRPVSQFNEIRNVVAEWDDDYGMSASRARLPWGIPWPGDESHVIYVWFEAVINYLTATGFPDAGYADMWPADVHVIGPDILRFHAAIWPAMLMAADLPIPRGVWCHGWINTSGSRFSKSAGVSLTLRDAIDRHGPDALRYYLLREMPWDADGNFSWDRFDTRYTSELADGYGNLASRILAMIRRYLNGQINEGGGKTALDRAGDEVVVNYCDAMDAHLLHEGGAAAWQLVAQANKFCEETAPWTLAKKGPQSELEAVLASLARTLSRITVMAWPFMPNKTQLVWEALGHVGEVAWKAAEAPTVSGTLGKKLSPLFPKPGSTP